MEFTKQFQNQCYLCGEGFKWGPKDPATGKHIRLNFNRTLHSKQYCDEVLAKKTNSSNKVQEEKKAMVYDKDVNPDSSKRFTGRLESQADDSKTFVRRTVAKYEENKQSEADRRKEMIEMHNENVAAWNAQTKATLELAKAMGHLAVVISSMRIEGNVK